MARKIRAREVLRLLESGMSRNAIARSQGMSKHSVQGNDPGAVPTRVAPGAEPRFRRC